jgi:hypothetical protein
MTNGVVLNALSDEETKDAIPFNEENEEEILIMIKKDIQEFKTNIRCTESLNIRVCQALISKNSNLKKQ